MSLHLGLATVRGGVTIMAVLLFICISGIRSSSQSIDPHYLKDRVILSTLAPASCVKVAPGTSAQLPSRGWSWGMGSCYSAKTEINQIL